MARASGYDAEIKRGRARNFPSARAFRIIVASGVTIQPASTGRREAARLSVRAGRSVFSFHASRAVMAKRYDPPGNAGDSTGGEGDAYDWIGEWLCEYVDGTMDPSMQAVFEEYMEANPELAEHVERLCRTRALLNGCECDQEQASGRAKERLRQEAAEDPTTKEEERNARATEIESQIQAALAEGEPSPDGGDALPLPQSTRAVVAAASAMTLMLGVGLFVGAVLFAEPPAPGSPDRSAAPEQTAPDRAPAPPSRALPRRRTASGPAVGRASTPRRWGAPPPFPLMKMPTTHADTAPSPAPLVQQTGFGRSQP